MKSLANEFTAAQRRVLDRYARFLGTLIPVFNTIPVIFQRRRNSGHQLAVLAPDSRLNNARFNERYLLEYWQRVETTRSLCSTYVADLATFARETREIIRQTSRSGFVDQVDFRSYTLAQSRVWKLFPPENVRDLIHELTLRFYELRADVQQLKYTLVELRNESFGLSAVFSKAMAHRSCQCHAQPSVLHELFRESATEPEWDMAYSSRDALIRAEEYRADITTLFNEFASVSSQASLYIESLYQRIDNVISELLRAKAASRLGELNFKLDETLEGAQACQALLEHLEGWLRK